MAWAKNGTPDTLGSSGDALSITDADSSFTFVETLIHSLDVTNAITNEYQFNADTANNYAKRSSVNGVADVPQNTQDTINSNLEQDADTLMISYIINISTEEKLLIGHQVSGFTAGAANAPARSVFVGKWANTSVGISRIDIVNTGAGSYNTDSNLSSIGTA